MHQKLTGKQQALINQSGSLLLYDSARFHISIVITQKSNKLGYEILPHLIYSPDYHLFMHLVAF